MQIPEEAWRLRILIGESDRFGGHPLYEAIVLKARELHLAGATVIRASMGYGATSRLHTAKLLRLSSDMPVVVEIVDAREKIDAFLPQVEAMASEGLVTLEPVTVVRYRGKHPGEDA